MIKKYFKPLFLSSITGILIGLAITLINPGSHPIIGFLSASILTFACSLILYFSWKKLGGDRQAGWATAATFIIRVLIGLILFITLPVYGYDPTPPNSGYLYLDAYQRDTDAWNLAVSASSLADAFKDEFYSDQYGGLLSLSAGLYRIFSPDSHRPLLILIITAFFTALGLPFFRKAVYERWGEKTANASAWIYALYPESIILGASQMREPILIGLSAILFWSVSQWAHNKRDTALALGFSTLGLIFISFKAAGVILLCTALYFWIDMLLPNLKKYYRYAGFILFIVLIATVVFFSWNWLVDSSKWDLYLMETSSGRIQWELELVGEKHRAPFIISYGMLQPVLPASFVYPGIPIMQSVSIFRSLGWYAILPLLISGAILVWKVQSWKDKGLILLILAIVLIWTLVSSARAGGDQWDNPRYRSILFIWFALLGGWSWLRRKESKSPWLWRILFLELTYTGFFIQWYLSRYYDLFKRLDFWSMIRLLGIIGAVVIFGGIFLDVFYYKRNKSSN